MPEKIILKNEDGTETEKEFFTAEDLEQARGETKAEYEDRVKQLEEDANPNWREARATMKQQSDRIKSLEANGKTINDQGEVVDLQPQAISMEQVEARAREIARSEQINIKKEEFVGQFDEDTRKVFEHNYNKLTAGEEVTLGNIQQFFNQAELLTLPDRGNPVKRAMAYGGGSPAKASQSDFSETDEGQGLASQMGLNYIKK